MKQLDVRLMTCEVTTGILWWRYTRYVYFFLRYYGEDIYSIDVKTKYYDPNEKLYKKPNKIDKLCNYCIGKELEKMQNTVRIHKNIKRKDIKPQFLPDSTKYGF